MAPRPNHLAGSLWMVCAGLLFVAVAVTVRHLGSDMPAAEAAFIRYLFGLGLMIPVFMRMQWRKTFSGPAIRLYVARGAAHGLAVMLWFYAMARISIAEVTAIGYTTPIFTALGAVLVFHERIHLRRVLAILAGFLGTLVILRPGLVVIEAGAVAQLLAAPCFAVSFLLTKKLTQTESASEILAMLSIFCTLALLPLALVDWRAPTTGELMWLFLVAIFATAGHYAMTRSFANAPLTVTQPFAFLQLLWAVLFGYLFFGEVPDIWVFVGGTIIIGAITYLTHREAVAAKKSARASTPAIPPA